MRHLPPDEAVAPAMLVARRCQHALLGSQDHAALWFWQWRTVAHTDYEAVCSELKKHGMGWSALTDPYYVNDIRNPSRYGHKQAVEAMTERETLDQLKDVRARWLAGLVAQTADTAVARLVADGLSVGMAHKGVVVVHGRPGVGISRSARECCRLSAGTARYVDVPAGGQRRVFLGAVSSALDGRVILNSDAWQMEQRASQAIVDGGPMIVFDNAHRLWTHGAAWRLDWVLERAEAGARIALLADTDLWRANAGESPERRWLLEKLRAALRTCLEAPGEVPVGDMERVAKVLMPGAGAKAIRAVALAVQAKGGSLADLDRLVQQARRLAQADGRSDVEASDAKAAIESSIGPSDQAFRNLIAAPRRVLQKRLAAPRAEAPQANCEGNADRLQSRFDSSSEGLPAARSSRQGIEKFQPA